MNVESDFLVNDHRDDGEMIDEEISIDSGDYTTDKFGNVLWSKNIPELNLTVCPAGNQFQGWSTASGTGVDRAKGACRNDSNTVIVVMEYCATNSAVLVGGC